MEATEALQAIDTMEVDHLLEVVAAIVARLTHDTPHSTILVDLPEADKQSSEDD
jgi:hypothetical protein